jgi:predicted phosphodiesterase
MWMFIFLLLPVMGIAYIGWHVWTLVPLPAVWRVSIIMAGVLSFLMIFLNFRRAIDDMPLPLARLVYDIGNSSVFILLYLVVIFLVLDLGRLLHLVRPQWMHQNFPLTACIVIGMFALFLYGNVHYHHKVREELHLTTDKPLARPLRIVMLSDLHLGYHNPRKELARWVDLINAENPDVVLIAGDVIDMSMRPLVEENMAEEMRRLEAPVYACLGNHEYYSSEPLAEQFYRDARIQLLRDTCLVVGDLCIMGRDDRTNLRRRNIDELARMADHTKYIILENVRNLVAHDNGNTWRTIRNHLVGLGYRLTPEPLIVSPHYFGVPQLRERVVVLGIYDPKKANLPLTITFPKPRGKSQCNLDTILEQDNHEQAYQLSEQEIDAINTWDEFYHGIKEKVIGFPIWLDWFKVAPPTDPK